MRSAPGGWTRLASYGPNPGPIFRGKRWFPNARSYPRRSSLRKLLRSFAESTKGFTPCTPDLIRLGKKSSVVNVFHMNDEIDGGRIIMKKDVSLEGSLEEILIRINKIIMEMINDFQTDYRKQSCGWY